MAPVVQSDLRVCDFLKPGVKAYLIGIGGIGMSGLAKVLRHLGLQVSGSDAKTNKETAELSKLGVQIYIGHDSAHIQRQDFIIYSSAISQKNPERREAVMRELPLFHRAEVLSALMNQAISIAVTGTHGKSTTSAMIAFLLSEAGVKPTCLVGARMLNFDSNVLLGDPKLLVAEVDESDRSQLFYRPDYAVLTNLEEDHLDTYQNFENLRSAFSEFIGGLKATGQLIYCGHDVYLKELSAQISSQTSYGLSKSFHYSADEVVLEGFSSRFLLYEKGKKIGNVSLNLPGKHNVLNALGAIATLRAFGVSWDAILKNLSGFKGVGRRLEIKLALTHLIVIDDYAHHPTEIEASLQSIRMLGKKVTAVFQPHRYSRTRYLAASFAKAFYQADRVVLTDIYGAGEENVDGVDVQDLYRMTKEKHPDVTFVPMKDLMEFLSSDANSEGVIAFLGAGDITEVADEFSKRFAHST